MYVIKCVNQMLFEMFWDFKSDKIYLHLKIL